MFLFWLLFSAWTVYIPQSYDMSQVFKGILVALIVAFLTHEIFLPCRGENILLKSRRFVAYSIWEMWQIYLATIDVTKRVIGMLPVDPRIIEFDTTLRSDLALTAFGNSITLTPGTITIDIEPERGRYMVHAIAKEPADSLTVDQIMQKKVAYVFMEE
ncbi:MAG: Na+/H+ antiporter subunit E [Methanotrichaceae archaeon]|nr:Na+/H+ antiporter subunit E [Methanotrichaceae archaeon]